MDGNTPINCDEPQFTQREAAELSGADMATINNWIQRKDFELTSTEGTRRMFSIGDIAALHAMHYCVKMLDMRPAAAGFAGRVVRNYYGEGGASKEYRIWHILKKLDSELYSYDEDEDEKSGWQAQGIWQDRASGAFFHYHPGLFGTEDPFGFPHFPCLSIPTSDMAHRIFLTCADRLMEEHGHPTGTATEGLDE